MQDNTKIVQRERERGLPNKKKRRSCEDESI